MESFYANFYLLYFFFTLIVFFDLLGSFFNRKLIYLNYQNFLVFLFLAFYYILLSTRSLDIGADTEKYYRLYESIGTYRFTNESSDIGFNLFNQLLNTLGVSPNLYLFFLSLLFIVPVFFTIKRLENTNKVFLLWFFASLFIFVSMSTNILRQGIGGVFVMWGISLFISRKNQSKKFLIPFLIAPFFHFSLLLATVLFFLSKYLKNIKIAYVVLCVSIFLSYIGFDINRSLENLPVIGILFRDRMEGYLGENVKNYRVGFRVDFLLFNLFFVAIGYYVSKLKLVVSSYPMYNQIYTAFILLTSYFVLMFNVPFSDRFGILSWILIPFITYPIFNLSDFRHTKLKLMSFFLGLSLFIIFNVIGL